MIKNDSEKIRELIQLTKELTKELNVGGIFDDLKKLMVYDLEIEDKGCSCCSPEIGFEKWREIGDGRWFSNDSVVKANDIIKLLDKHLGRDEN
jgi:hypothetical protein